jgi:predicted metalloendopeptidase
MTSTTNKIRKKTTNKSRKKPIDKYIKIINGLTPNEINVLCKKKPTTYNTFEDKIEKKFKDNKIDFLSVNYNLEKQILKDLKKAVSPSNISPQNDFYSYINERWLNKYELEKSQQYITQVDDFRIIQDKVYKELKDIIIDYLDNPKNHNDKKRPYIKTAFESFNTTNTRKQQMHDAKNIVVMIDELIKDKDNLWKLLANYNTNEIVSWSCPFVWKINPDEKNPKIYKCYLESPQLSLIDIDVYIDDGKNVEYKKKYRKHFFSYLSNIFTLAFGSNHEFNIEDVFNCEVKILYAMGCDLIKIKDSDNYNLVTKKEALNNFNFNWEVFAKELGFKEIPEDFVTSNINYLLCGTKLLLDEWNSKEWRTYWIYIYIKQIQRFSYYGRNEYFNFNGKFMRGQQEIVSEGIYSVFPMCYLFNTFLSNEYIRIYNNKTYNNYVLTMVEDLKTVFIRILARNKWLQPKTKLKAIKKLKYLKIIIDSPEIVIEDPLLDYKSHDPWGNLEKMAFWIHNKSIKLVNKPVIDIHLMDWSQYPVKMVGKQPYVVNAFYTPTENSIYIPLAYIQKPFVDLDQRGIEYNLAHLGFTISHEMSHALDDLGRRYNEFGQLDKWWTPSDEKYFYKIQKDVVKQYEAFASYDGIKFDAWPSIGEDLADISGITICVEYLRDFQLKNQDILPIQSTSFHTFFIYFAMQQRQKVSQKALQAQLKTNPHPLDKYRTNVPLSRLLVFRVLFNVKKGDKMWWHSTNRVWEG